MHTKVLVIGAGNVGSFIIQHLPEYQLTVLDRQQAALDRVAELPQVQQTLRLEHTEALPTILHDLQPRLVVSCVPGDAGYDVARTVLQTGTPVVDISFMPQDAFALLPIATAHQTWYIPDAGIAPGLSNLFLGWISEQMTVEEFRCYVGGLPQRMNPPLYYEAPFHAYDALAEYIRPAKIRQGGRTREVQPLAAIEYVNLFHKEAGTLAAFYSDGLRTLLRTLPDIPTMAELTLRYRPHIEIMRTFADLHLLTAEKLPTLAQWLRPFLIPKGADMTLLWCEARNSAGEYATLRLTDVADPNHLSMSRMTGTVALSVIEAVLGNSDNDEPALSFEEPGVYPLELLPQLFDRVIDKLTAAGAKVTVECQIP